MGKYVIIFISLFLFILGLYMCYTGEAVVGRGWGRHAGTTTVVPGLYVLFLSLLIFCGYFYTLRAVKKENREHWKEEDRNNFK